MKKKILIISILAATIMILLPISSVVGTNEINSRTNKINSPLFAAKQKFDGKLQSNYLGKGRLLSIFYEKKINYASQFDKSISYLKRNPVLFNKIIDKIQAHPKIDDILKENDISLVDFESYANKIKQNPLLLEQEIKKVEQYIPDNSAIPLGLNTTNPFAIIILIIAILPIFLVLGVLIATITIITCLNIAGCFEELMNNLIDGFIQGLTQPE